MVWWLGTVTPCAIITCLVSLDLACRLGPLRRVFRWIGVPFTNFLVLEDLLDPIGKIIQPPAWKRRAFVALPAAQALSWVALFFYTLLVPDSMWLIRSGVSAIIWVRVQRVVDVPHFLITIVDYRAVLASDLQRAPPPPPRIFYSYSVLRLLSQQLGTYTFPSLGSRRGSGTHYSPCSGRVFRFYCSVF